MALAVPSTTWPDVVRWRHVRSSDSRTRRRPLRGASRPGDRGAHGRRGADGGRLRLRVGPVALPGYRAGRPSDPYRARVLRHRRGRRGSRHHRATRRLRGRRLQSRRQHLPGLPQGRPGELPQRRPLRRLPGRTDPDPVRRRHPAGHAGTAGRRPDPRRPRAIGRDVHRLARGGQRRRRPGHQRRGRRRRRGRTLRGAGVRPAGCAHDHRDEPPPGPPGTGQPLWRHPYRRRA